ncbi:MAG TPA: glycoside hydrolase family 76 protein [Polyangiaceae bacterium]|jgi:predicted alpha-1,6-mannanase (GH76 family)
MRLAHLATVAAVGAAIACASADDGSSSEALSAHDHDAVEATNTFVNLFFDTSSDNLRDSHPFQGAWAMPGNYWKYAQGFDAVLDSVERSQGSEFEIHAQQLFKGWHDWPGQMKRSWFDDENWVALALLHAHRVMKHPNGDYRDLASATYDDIWARGATHDAHGNFTGIYESIAPGSAFYTKAAVSNFGPAITAARLGHVTEAREIYGWARQHLSDPTTGEVYDHVEPNGDVVKWHYTYCFGVAIGAALELYQTTHETQFRDDAYAYAGYMVEHLVTQWKGKAILYDGCEARCETERCDCSTFKGIGYRYLAMLYGSKIGASEHPTETQRIHDVLAASVEALRSARSPSGTYPSDWGGGWRSFSSLGSEASAVMTLNIAVEHGM